MGEGFVASSPIFLSVFPCFEVNGMAQLAEICCEFMFVCAVAVCEKMPFNECSGKSRKKVYFLTFCKLLKINAA